jgi:hypothetical protein
MKGSKLNLLRRVRTMTTQAKYTTKTAPELKVGDVVIAHGARLRLTVLNINAEKAKVLADNYRGLALHHARSELDRARAEEEYQRSLTLRNFSVEFLGYLPGVHDDLSATWWNKNYNVQGNHLATWPVET